MSRAFRLEPRECSVYNLPSPSVFLSFLRIMAQRRAREGNGHPELPGCMKTLRDHGVLNGILYYKANGLKDEQAAAMAKYLVHIGDDERGMWWDKIMGGATSQIIAKVAEAYQDEVVAVADEQKNKVRRRDTLVIDCDGKLH